MRLQLFHWIVLAWLPVSPSWAQEAPQYPPGNTPTYPVISSQSPNRKDPSS